MSKSTFPRHIWVERQMETNGSTYLVVYEKPEDAAMEKNGGTFGVYELKETQELSLRVISGNIKKVMVDEKWAAVGGGPAESTA